MSLLQVRVYLPISGSDILTWYLLGGWICQNRMSKSLLSSLLLRKGLTFFCTAFLCCFLSLTFIKADVLEHSEALLFRRFLFLSEVFHTGS